VGKNHLLNFHAADFVDFILISPFYILHSSIFETILAILERIERLPLGYALILCSRPTAGNAPVGSAKG
jgi:hypothetical protein